MYITDVHLLRPCTHTVRVHASVCLYVCAYRNIIYVCRNADICV